MGAAKKTTWSQIVSILQARPSSGSPFSFEQGFEPQARLCEIFSQQTLVRFPALYMGPQCHGVLEAISILVQLASLTQVLGEPGSVQVLR